MKLSSKVKTVKHVVHDDPADLSGKCILDTCTNLMTFQNYIFHHFHTVANFPSYISHYINISSLDVEVEPKSTKPSPKIKTNLM